MGRGRRGYWQWKQALIAEANPPRAPRGRRRKRRKDRSTRVSRYNPATASLPQESGPVVDGPWDALFSHGELSRRQVVLFPVNPTAVLMAAHAFRTALSYPRYRDAVRQLLSHLGEYGVDTSQVVEHGRINEDALGNLVEEIFAYDESGVLGFIEPKWSGEGAPEDLQSAREVLSAVNKISFDLRVPYRGRAENYLPLGLQEEWEALQGTKAHPFPDFGILGGQGLLGITTLSAQAFQKQVVKLSDIVKRAEQPGKMRNYPVVSVGDVRAYPPSVLVEAERAGVPPPAPPRTFLGLMASGPLSEHEGSYRIAPVGVGKNEPALYDGLARTLITAKLWDLSNRAWQGVLAFALPAPFYEKGKELTGSTLFANSMCSPTINYSSGKVSIDVALGPKSEKITGGRLTLGTDAIGITDGRLVRDASDPHYVFTAENEAAGKVRGRFTVEKEGKITLTLFLTEILRGMVALGVGIEGGKPITLVRQSAQYNCPSPHLQMGLARAVDRLMNEDPLPTLRLLRGGALSAKDHQEITATLAAAQRFAAVGQTMNVFPTVLASMVQEAAFVQTWRFPPGTPQASPLFFLGFGSAVPANRVFPVPRSVLDRAAAGDGVFSVKDERTAKRIGLTKIPTSDSKEWAHQDQYHRWILSRQGKLFRLTLVGVEPGEWIYSIVFGDPEKSKKTGHRASHRVAARVVKREYARAEAAAGELRQVSRRAEQLVARLLSPLIQRAEGELPGLSNLPVEFKGAFCPDLSDPTGPPTPCTTAVRQGMRQAKRLPLTFYLPSETESGPSWYGDPPKIRNVPGKRHMVVYARHRATKNLPTLLQMQRLIDKKGKDPLSLKYESFAHEVEKHRRYNVQEMREVYKEEGERGAQALDDTLFDTRERTVPKARTVPLPAGRLSPESPVERLVVTIYGVLDDINVAVMKRRNEALGGTDRSPKDAAYAGFLAAKRLRPSKAMPEGIKRRQEQKRKLDATAKRLKLTFNKDQANALLAGNKAETARERETSLKSGELGVTSIRGPSIRGTDVYLRLKGKRGGSYVYALSFDGSFRDITPPPPPPLAAPLAPLIPDPGWLAFLGAEPGASTTTTVTKRAPASATAAVSPAKKLVLKAIISGGQSGADQGGLAAAVGLGLRTGGTMPRGFRAYVEVPGGSSLVDGAIPELANLPSGGLKEHHSKEWAPRTKVNVSDADGTLWFGDPTSPGGNLTLRTALGGPREKRWDKARLSVLHGPQVGAGAQKGYPVYVHQWRGGQQGGQHITRASTVEFAKWLVDNQIEVLNVAGNRDWKAQKGIFTAVQDFIEQGVKLAQQQPAQSNPYRRQRAARQNTMVRRPFYPTAPFVRRNPESAWFSEYGVFYQVALTKTQIEKILSEYRIWAEQNRELRETRNITLNFMDHLKPFVLNGQKTMTVRKGKGTLKRGEVGAFRLMVDVPGKKRRKKFPMYARSWGPMSFEDFTTELGRGDAIKGMNEFVRRENLPVTNANGQRIASYTSALQLAEARVMYEDEDGHQSLGPFMPDYGRAWIKGRKKLTIYDLSFEDRICAKGETTDCFEPLPEGDLVFNPANALLKAICDQSGLTRHPGDQSTTESLSQIWRRLERPQDEAKPRILPAPFSVVGTLQVDLNKLDKTGRAIPRALAMNEKSGILLFSLRIPTSRGVGNCPDEARIEGDLYTEVGRADGVFAAGGSPHTVKQLSEYLTQTEWFRSKGYIVPLMGRAHQLPNILAFQPVSQTERFDRVLKSVKEEDEEGEDPRLPEMQLMDAYYHTLNTEISGFSGSRRTPAAVLAGQVAYSAHGGRQGRATRAGLPTGTWATKQGRSFADFLSFVTQICRKTGECLPHDGGRRGEVVALTRPRETYLSADALFARRAKEMNRIRTGQSTVLNIDEDLALIQEIEEGVPYMTEVGNKLFFVDATAVEDGYSLEFKPVPEEDTTKENKLYVYMAELGIKLPEPPTGKRGRLRWLKSLKPALQQLKDQLRVRYKHEMNLGLLPQQLEQDALLREAMTQEGVEPGLRESFAAQQVTPDDTVEFAEPYLKDMAKPNSKYGRRGRRRRRSRGPRDNPLREEGLDRVESLVRTGKWPDFSPGSRDSRLTPKELKTEYPEWWAAQGAFDALRKAEGSPEGWKIDKTGLDTLFPPQGKERPDTWAVADRISQALGPGGFNLVSRLSKLRDDEVVAYVTDGKGTPTEVTRGLTAREVADMALRQALPFQDAKALSLIMKQAELSLEEAIAILAEQRMAVKRRGKGGRHTMQPSSAVCKRYRKRRLTTLRLEEIPRVLGEDRWPNSTLILMSPKGAPIPRVMTWRRGDHIDCDMVGKSPADMTMLLGKAIQSALFWVAEKPQRRMIGKGATSIYVARVGQAGLYLAWEPGQAVNLATVTANLQEPMKGKLRMSGEVEAYIKAERDLGIGSGAHGAPEWKTYEEEEIGFGEEIYGTPPAEPGIVTRKRIDTDADIDDEWSEDLMGIGEERAEKQR